VHDSLRYGGRRWFKTLSERPKPGMWVDIWWHRKLRKTCDPAKTASTPIFPGCNTPKNSILKTAKPSLKTREVAIPSAWNSDFGYFEAENVGTIFRTFLMRYITTGRMLSKSTEFQNTKRPPRLTVQLNLEQSKVHIIQDTVVSCEHWQGWWFNV